MSADSTIQKSLGLPKPQLWIFGYGSLMWNPGFEYAQSSRARIYGYHRSLCIRSVRYRGTNDLPGLVFGLDRGGSCTGVGFRIERENQLEVAHYLEEREMLHQVYEPCLKPIVLADDTVVEALTFVVKRRHSAYIKGLSIQQTADIVACAHGQRGSNLDYVQSTLKWLEKIGIDDPNLNVVNILAQQNQQEKSKAS